MVPIYETGGVHYKMHMNVAAIQVHSVDHLVFFEALSHCKSQSQQFIKVCQIHFIVRKGNKEMLQLERFRFAKSLLYE